MAAGSLQERVTGEGDQAGVREADGFSCEFWDPAAHKVVIWRRIFRRLMCVCLVSVPLALACSLWEDRSRPFPAQHTVQVPGTYLRRTSGFLFPSTYMFFFVFVFVKSLNNTVMG